MINDKTLELINRDLDGALSQKEKTELEKRLENDLEAKALLNKFRLLHKNLSEMPETEPPVDLKENVMRALPVVCRAEIRYESSLKSKIVDLLSLPRFQMAGMFSLGAAAAILFLVVAQDLSNDRMTSPEKLIGTIIHPAENAEVETIESKDIIVDNHKVSVVASRSEKTVFVSISLISESNDVIQFTASCESAENFRFNGLEYDAPNLIYANFGTDFISAAVAGSGKWILAFEDVNGTAEVLKIELKTESGYASETVAVQRIVGKNGQ